MWHDEISSVMSIQQIVPAKQDNQSVPVYIMDVQGDYYFDDFLEQGGAENDSQLIDYVVGNITKRIIPVPVIYDARQLEQVYHIVKGEVK